MRTAAGLTLALAVLLPAGCEPARRAPPVVRGSPYYPLAVGTAWVYRGGDRPRTLRVAKHELLGATPCALVQTSHGGEVVEEQHVFATGQGVFVLGTGGQKLTRPLPLLVLPPTKGRTWTYQMKLEGRLTRHEQRLDEETVTVPAGTFRCVVVRSEVFAGAGRLEDFALWFARDVGIVKQLRRAGDQEVVYELEAYTPGGG